MGKDTPLARGVRTFVTSLAAVAGTWVLIDWTTAWQSGAIQIGLAVIAAAIAAVSSFLLATAGLTATSAAGKALATFAQYVGAGLATVAVASLSIDALHDAGSAIARIVMTGVFAAVASFLTNAAEDHGAAPTP